MGISIEEQRQAQARRDAGEEEEIRIDSRLILHEEAVKILAGIEAAGPSLKYTQNRDPRDKHGPPPQVFEATFATNLGHFGVGRKPRVLGIVAGPRASGCGALREVDRGAILRKLSDAYQIAWDRYDVDSFKLEGSISCSNPTHHAHECIATFAGLKLVSLGLKGRGTRPAPQPPEPRPVAQVKPRPSAEEILREAVRADAR